MPDSEELQKLRVSIARIAQSLGVESSALPVLNKPFNGLRELSIQHDRGWNNLACSCLDVIHDQRDELLLLSVVLDTQDDLPQEDSDEAYDLFILHQET